MAESEARNLSVSQTQQRVILPFRNFHRGGERPFDHSTIGIIAKLCRIILSVGIIEDSFFRDRNEGNASVILNRFPGTKSFLPLLWKHGWIAGSLEGFLCHSASHLVVPMAVRAAADKNGCDDQWTRFADDANYVGQDAVSSPLS